LVTRSRFAASFAAFGAQKTNGKTLVASGSRTQDFAVARRWL